jgi:hypothetical protein
MVWLSMLAGFGLHPAVAPVLRCKLAGPTPHALPQLPERGLRVRPAPLVPASEQGQVAFLLGLGVLLEDLGVVRVEDPPRLRLPHAAASLALDARDQAPGGAQGVLLGRRSLQARRLSV